MSIGAGSVVIGYSLFSRQRLKVENSYIRIIFLIALFLFTGIFLMNSALHKAPASIVAAIIGSSAMITNLIGFVFYKERFLKHQYLGILVIVVSLFVLNYFS